MYCLVLLLCSATWLPARGRRDAPKPATQPGVYTVATTVAMVGDIVSQVAGGRANVSAIIGQGVDPHLYTPTRSDVQRLLDADVIFYVGLLLEAKMGDVLDKMGDVKPVFAVTSLLDERYLRYPQEFGQHPDPHVWMDVGAWSAAVTVIAERLAEFDPSGAEHYRDNAEYYRSRLTELDDYARQAMATVAPRRRLLVTAHDAFGYFGRAYGIAVRGIQGLSTESEAGLNDINGLVDLIVRRDIEAIFVETSVADKNIRALIEGAAAVGHTVRVGGTLYSDANGRRGYLRGHLYRHDRPQRDYYCRRTGGYGPAAWLERTTNCLQGGMTCKLSIPTPAPIP